MEIFYTVLTAWFIFSVLAFFYWELNPERKGLSNIEESTLFEGIVKFGVLGCLLAVLAEGIQRWILGFIPNFMDDFKGYLSIILGAAVIGYLGSIYKKATRYDADEKIRYEAEEKRREEKHQQD